MLELIGLIAIIFVIVKFFPDIMLFAVKAAVVVIGLYFLVGGLLWIFGASIAFNINTQFPKSKAKNKKSFRKKNKKRG